MYIICASATTFGDEDVIVVGRPIAGHIFQIASDPYENTVVFIITGYNEYAIF